MAKLDQNLCRKEGESMRMMTSPMLRKTVAVALVAGTVALTGAVALGLVEPASVAAGCGSLGCG